MIAIELGHVEHSKQAASPEIQALEMLRRYWRRDTVFVRGLFLAKNREKRGQNSEVVRNTSELLAFLTGKSTSDFLAMKPTEVEKILAKFEPTVTTEIQQK